MNSMLDENRKMCLKSRETIPLCENVTIFFEVLDLSYASPSTISRCGIVNTEATSIGWQNYVHKWIHENDRTWSQPNQLLILDLFDWILPSVSATISSLCAGLVLIFS